MFATCAADLNIVSLAAILALSAGAIAEIDAVAAGVALVICIGDVDETASFDVEAVAVIAQEAIAQRAAAGYFLLLLFIKFLRFHVVFVLLVMNC